MQATELVTKSRKVPCGPCHGDGTVLVDPTDRRQGEKSCPTCEGLGEL